MQVKVQSETQTKQLKRYQLQLSIRMKTLYTSPSRLASYAL